MRIRRDWENVKEQVMMHALQRKFEAPEVRELLLSTDDRPLIEASPPQVSISCHPAPTVHPSTPSCRHLDTLD